MSSRDLPRVELPSPEEDRPAWGRVGVIAVLGFLVGVAWPRLAGISLGPNPPADAPRAAAASAAPGKTSLSGVTAAPGPIPGASAALAQVEGAASNELGVTLGAPEIARCRDAKGKTPDACDKLAVEGVFEPRLKELARCPSALGLTGKVSFGFDLDFKNKTLKVQRAKATKLPKTTLDGLTRCVEKSFNGVSLDEINHENNRYSVAYEVTFQPPNAPSAGGAEPTPEAPRGTPLSGKTGKITWGSCQVREAPAKNASVLGKLPRRAEVKLLEEKDGWYRIEYRDKPQAWIFGEAVKVD